MGQLLGISVIIPHFADAHGAIAALESVMCQSLPPLEVVIVDDGSPLPQFESLSYLIDKQFRGGGSIPIKLIRMPINKGPSAARNLALEHSVGSHVAFLDSDDVWHPMKLEIQSRVFDIFPNTTLVCHRHEKVNAGFSLLAADAVAGGPWAQTGRPQNTVLRRSDWLKKNWAPTPSVMLRADWGARFNEDRRHAEDYELWLRIAFSGGEARFVDKALAFSSKNPFGDSGLSSQLLRMEMGELGALRTVCKEFAIPFPVRAAVYVWSLGKFIRRLGVVTCRRLRG